MLKGRLGLETARIPQTDRHGVIWLGRGRLYVENGTLRFVSAGGRLAAGDYALPFQMITAIFLEPGGTVSHDALRLLARHGTALIAIGEDGARHYASMPFGPDDSRLARRQVAAWSDPERRNAIARQMYAWRLDEELPEADIAVLRGIEGARMRKMYKNLAARHGIPWGGRKYDRANPSAADAPNQAINHVVTVVEACASVAVAMLGLIPQLGFIHEDSGVSLCLDVADLFRDSVTIPVAFAAAKVVLQDPTEELEPIARRLAGKAVRERALVPQMIDRLKELFDGDDGSGHS